MSMTNSQGRPSETEVIKSICSGEREAFYELVRPYERMINFELAKSGRKSRMQPAAASPGPEPAASIYLSVIIYYISSKWSGRKDLNLRPPGPEPGTKIT